MSLPTVLLLLLLTCASCRASSDDPASRARAMLLKMTLEEKITMCHGGPTKCAQQQRACLPAPENCNILRRYTGEIAGNDRLNIPPLRMNDGPQGFRTSDGSKGTSTAWPSALTLAATFDTQLAGEWGRAMGQEFRDKGAGMQVAPSAPQPKGTVLLPTAKQKPQHPLPIFRSQKQTKTQPFANQNSAICSSAPASTSRACQSAAETSSADPLPPLTPHPRHLHRALLKKCAA